MQLVLKMTAQIKDTENQIESLMQENESLKKAQEVPIPTVIPTASKSIPSTWIEHLAPKGVLATAVSITSKDISATSSSTSQVNPTGETTAIVKAMEDKEIISLKGTIRNLETSNRDAIIA